MLEDVLLLLPLMMMMLFVDVSSRNYRMNADVKRIIFQSFDELS